MRAPNYKQKLEQIQRTLASVDKEYCQARDEGDDYIAVNLTPQERRAVELAGYKVTVGVHCDFIYT